ncbi:MAG: phosphatase PAP2 family protein [Candidatus Zixiibacteriota bacterium]|nr:MAG: phosphatase PAP2 family protein [candidate division Zixibacteria bacterium]
MNLSRLIKNNAKVLLALIALSAASFSTGRCKDYLSGQEVVSISAASVSLLTLGQLLKHSRRASDRALLIDGTLPGDMIMHDLFAGACSRSKHNFLDDSKGSAYTPLAGGLVLFAADMSWPRNDSRKDGLQDLFLYGAGLTATKGVTDLSKGIFARPRPYMYFVRGKSLTDVEGEKPRDFQSLFSGHASSAYYPMAFLNKRIRFIMKNELSPSEYRSWRWLPPLVTWGWASFVGISRVQACKHYFSDILIGAAVGFLLQELFYSFGSDDKETDTAAETSPMYIRLELKF